MGFELLPWCWHIFSVPLEASRGISTETCGSGDVFPPDDIGSGFVVIALLEFGWESNKICIEYELWCENP